MSFRGQLLKAGIDSDGKIVTIYRQDGRFDIATASEETSGTIRSANIEHTVQANSMSLINETLRVSLESEYYTGDWSNAIVGRIDYGDTGDARGGMAAAICAEMNMPAKSYASIGGPCYSLDCEFNCPTGFVAGDRVVYPIAFINFGLWGGAKAQFDAEGYLFHTDGLTAGSGKLLSTNSRTLRVNIEGADKYIYLSDTENDLGTMYTDRVSFTTAISGGDANVSFINIGTYAAALAVAPTTAHMFGVMHNVSLTNINVAYWYQAQYTKITTSGTTTQTSIAGHALRINAATSLGAVYGIQCHTNLSGTSSIATEAISVSAYVNLASGATITTDRVCALQAMIEGAGGVVTGDSVVAYFVNAGTASDTDSIIEVKNQSACTVGAAITLDLDGVCTYAFDFAGTVSDAWTTGTAGTSLTPSAEYVLIPIDVAGTTNPLFLLAAQTWTVA